MEKENGGGKSICQRHDFQQVTSQANKINLNCKFQFNQQFPTQLTQFSKSIWPKPFLLQLNLTALPSVYALMHTSKKILKVHVKCFCKTSKITHLEM